MVFEFFSTNPAQAESYQMAEIYGRCSSGKQGGGVLAGSLAYLSCKLLGMVGTVLFILVLGIVCLVIVTEKSLIGGMAAGGRRVYERSREDAAWRRERADERREAQARRREESERERRAKEEELENEKLLRMDKKVSGVMLDTALGREEEKAREEKIRDDIHEIMINDEDDETEEIPTADVHSRPSHHYIEQESDDMDEIHMEATDILPEQPMDSWQPMTGNQMKPSTGRPRAVAAKKPQGEAKSGESVRPRSGRDTYRFPTTDLLDAKRGKKGTDSDRELKETANRLEQILSDFGVKVTVTQYSRGPSVTRYELQPEQGVKVSKIVGLTDDIKLNLAATDIRIEAPIPGKA
ncbi:MAG: DNA translocase FtsK, partial [Lachnospiraceae bacterium]|nr:DNA translocase FtsK [Lachnospiraceae bacterium]